MSRQLIDHTRGKWRGILTALGLPESHLTGKHCPCPMCGGKDRFRFDDKNGSGSWICNNCGSGFGIHLVGKALGLDLSSAWRKVESMISSPAAINHFTHPEKQYAHAREENSTPTGKTPNVKVADIWAGATDANDAPVLTAYLGSRGIKFHDDMRALRLVQRALYLDENGDFAGRFACMIGLIQAPDGRACGLHRTFLGKAGAGQASVPVPKKISGEVPDGAAVRLFARDTHLGIAEGIETALSAYQLFGVPTWAALTAGGIEKWTPPDGVQTATVFGDNDRNFRGQKAAYVLAHRLALKGFAVNVEIPTLVGDDWNDVLRRGVA